MSPSNVKILKKYLRKSMAWSKYQNDIFDYACNLENGSFCISAVAGSGKTTTIVECARRLAMADGSLKILFLAFNKSIADKLKTHTAEFPQIKCSTLHALGLAAMYKSNLKFVLNDNKYKNFVRDNWAKYSKTAKTLNSKKIWIFIKNCTDLLRLCRLNLVEPNDTDGVAVVAYHHSIDPIADEVETVSKMLSKCRSLVFFKKKNAYEIDYTDMICFPLTDAFSKYIFKYDIVFIDEAQDLNKAQQELMLSAVKPGGKFIAAGDRRQSIMGFGSALSDSFDKLCKRADNVELPLSVNYRCGYNIIKEAKEYAPQIEQFEDAEPGEVKHTNTLKDAKPGDMVLCRKTNPLLYVALNMMRHGKSAYVLGTDIAEKMKMMIDRVSDDDSSLLSLDMLYDKLDERIRQKAEELRERGIKNLNTCPSYIAVADAATCIKTVGTSCSDVPDLLKMIDKLFDDTQSGNAVMLSTVHKAKGLEADNVFIICPEILPMISPGQLDWERQQENNLRYVAITRPKKCLTYVDVPEKMISGCPVV